MVKDRVICGLDEMLRNYVDGSNISKIVYRSASNRWYVYYNDGIETDGFDSPEEMIEFMDGDQNNY
jgi:hypothetical protein